MELLVYNELLFRIGKLQSETFIGFLTSKSRSTTLGTNQPELSDSFIFVIWVIRGWFCLQGSSFGLTSTRELNGLFLVCLTLFFSNSKSQEGESRRRMFPVFLAYILPDPNFDDINMPILLLEQL